MFHNRWALVRLLFADVKRKALAALNVQGQPQPLRVGLFAHKAAEFVRFGLQVTDQKQTAALRDLKIMCGCRLIEHSTWKGHQPLHAHAYGTADSAQRESFLEQALDQRPVLARDPALLKLSHKRAATDFALMVLLAVVEMAVLFVARRSAPRAILSYDHD